MSRRLFIILENNNKFCFSLRVDSDELFESLQTLLVARILQYPEFFEVLRKYDLEVGKEVIFYAVPKPVVTSFFIFIMTTQVENIPACLKQSQFVLDHWP